MLRLLSNRFRNRKSNKSSLPRFGSRRLCGEWLERRDMLSGAPPTVVAVQVSSTQWSESFLDFLEPGPLVATGYTIPTGSSAQTATLSWTGLDQIKIRFSEDVFIDAEDLSLSGVNTTAYSFSDFHYDPQARLATWTLNAPLQKDRLRIDLDANGLNPIRDLQNNVLDGEWTNGSSTVSGNGVAGGDFEFLINVVPGDVNNNGVVMLNDYDAVNQSIGKTTADAGYLAIRDIDGSGTINLADRDLVYARMGHALPSGTPAGSSNDAPTTTHLDLIKITGVTTDVVFDMEDWFDDNESGSSGLTYSLVSNSNGGLFDSATVNSSTKSLTLNAANGASGRAALTIRAIDPGGMFVDTIVYVDVNYVNLKPGLEMELPNYIGDGMWIISGRVIDGDDDLSTFIVQFTGIVQTRAAADEYGNFEFAVWVDPDTWGEAWAWTADPHVAISNVVNFDIGLT